MGQYAINQLIMHITPKAETILKFPKLGHAEFNFPKVIKTILFIRCNPISYNKYEYECEGRLYASENPKDTGELHIGLLYIQFTGSSEGENYKTTIEILEHYRDGSFDIITEDGQRNHIKKSLH